MHRQNLPSDRWIERFADWVQSEGLLKKRTPGRDPDDATGPVKQPFKESSMCRNIKTLFNFEPPVTEEEIRAASLQFVRKLSGFNKPSKANEAAFFDAVKEVARISGSLLNSLETNAPPRNRLEEAAKARARTAQRFPTSVTSD
jgi:hypothetical protein